MKIKKCNDVIIHSASHCECREGVIILLKFNVSIEGMTMLKGKGMESWMTPNR